MEENEYILCLGHEIKEKRQMMANFGWTLSGQINASNDEYLYRKILRETDEKDHEKYSLINSPIILVFSIDTTSPYYHQIRNNYDQYHQDIQLLTEHDINSKKRKRNSAISVGVVLAIDIILNIVCGIILMSREYQGATDDIVMVGLLALDIIVIALAVIFHVELKKADKRKRNAIVDDMDRCLSESKRYAQKNESIG